MSEVSKARLVRVAVVAVALLVASVSAAAAADRYVALGDSFSAGVGTGTYTLSSSCKRSTLAYPYLLSQQRAGTTLVFVACNGATTADLLSGQLPSVDAATTIVTVTIGGNDIGFANLIAQCTVADCSAALDATRSTIEPLLGPRLDAVYAGIKGRAAPGARIVVLGYPRIFSSASCLGALGVTATERTKANQLADALDATIAAHAAAQGVTYQSAVASFSTHAVCSGSPWLNGLNLFQTVESYHPNRTGHASGYLPLVRAITG